jgi:transcriptional regulator with XRE-family HTH domain
MSMQTVDVASEVRAAIARKRVKQNALAAALGLSQPAISRRLSGDIEFSITELTATAQLLNIPLGDLLPIPTSPAPAGDQQQSNTQAATFPQQSAVHPSAADSEEAIAS